LNIEIDINLQRLNIVIENKEQFDQRIDKWEKDSIDNKRYLKESERRNGQINQEPNQFEVHPVKIVQIEN
jgi:hypothetical protein